jgi:hypothetical protein
VCVHHAAGSQLISGLNTCAKIWDTRQWRNFCNMAG